MKKIICLFIVTFVGISLTFACKFNKRTHKITECENYKTIPMPEKCRKAHDEYNKWVLAQAKEKLNKKIEDTKKEYKDTTDQLKEDSKKITDQAESTGNKLKDSLFKFLEKNFSSEDESKNENELENNENSEDVENNIL